MTKSSSPRSPPASLMGSGSFLVSPWRELRFLLILPICTAPVSTSSWFLSGLVGRGAGAATLPKIGTEALDCVPCPASPERNPSPEGTPFWAGLSE